MPDFTMDWSEGTLDGERILKLTGPFTLSTVFDFQDVVRSHRPPITIVDLTDVPYMDSAALGSILGLHVSCQKDHRRYALVGASDRLQTMFQASGVGSVLLSFSTLADAETAVDGKVASA
jgi:anti-anti-sigma factor